MPWRLPHLVTLGLCAAVRVPYLRLQKFMCSPYPSISPSPRKMLSALNPHPFPCCGNFYVFCEVLAQWKKLIKV